MKRKIFAVICLCGLLAGCGRMEMGMANAEKALESMEEKLETKLAPDEIPAPREVTAETAAPQAEKLTAAQAEEIALNHAGLTHSQVENLRSHYDRDDGVEEYDVEFRSGDYDYDYTVDAHTGAILSQEKEYEAPPATPAQEKQITAEEAQAIALAHAGFAADQVERLRTRFEPEEPRDPAHYDVEFYRDGLEYDYEIHAETGQILSWEKDRDD